MANRLSYSKISAYSLCGKRYYWRYVQGYQEKFPRASLLFGSAIDVSLNSLLADRDLEKAKQIFDKNWNFGWVNKQLVALKENPEILYGASDLDKDLVEISAEDEQRLISILEAKKNSKWEDLFEDDRIFLNTLNWQSMYRKGIIILDSYFEKVLPEFLSVEAIQYETELTNTDGDTVIQYLDFIATLQDGSKILFDNKTTSSLSYYSDDAPGTSQQLVSYYFSNKEKFQLTGVGYVAMQKNINKNKIKKCNKCGVTAEEGSRVKTCAVELEPGVKKSRCGGEFDITMNPECAIKIIVNPVTDAVEDLVLSSFDEANVGIKNQNYYHNLLACNNIYGSPCEYKNLCYKGDASNLIKKENQK